MPPSQRLTRSTAARLNADTASATATPPETASGHDDDDDDDFDDDEASIAVRSNHAHTPTTSATETPPTRATASSRKRKTPPPTSQRSQRRSKRAKADSETTSQVTASAEPPRKGNKAAAIAAMSSSAGSVPECPDDGAPPGRPVVDVNSPSSANSAETSPQQAPRDSSRRKSSRHHKSKGTDHNAAGSAPSSSSRKSRKGSHKDQDVIMREADERRDDAGHGNTSQDASASDAREGSRPEGSRDAESSSDPTRPFPTQSDLAALNRGEDPFAEGGFMARLGGAGGFAGLRALTGMLSSTGGRLRNILEQLRTKGDPSVQLIALQELSELLLVSNEDNLAGHFAPDQYVKELITLMQPDDFTGEENPEIMLMACRCIANMMEALPAATSSVVYGGAVPILCQKLLEIHFIDLAEQALSTLEKISVEFPSSIVREGGLTACLTYLDFFATGTQRTAVTTAANCCRNIPEDSFPTVRDVMPILLNTLSSSDQRVVEQASLCVSRIVDSFKYHESKLEELVSPELLQAILRLLLPGSTNLIGPSLHTQFLRVLSYTARASPRLCVELLKMNVVDTLYQILTGVSAPTGTDQIAAKIDKNVIMQSIIRTPREQIFETLNVICEILPTVSQGSLMFLDELPDAGFTGPGSAAMSTRSRASPNDKRLELLRDCPDQVRRFAIILFPTLMHAYTSTVNLSVRQKVLTAQLKMLSNLDTAILEEALRGVPYSSHLASILSQQENHTLVTFALQAAEILLQRLESTYRPQFYREGVMSEIDKLSVRPLKSESSPPELANVEVVEPSSEDQIALSKQTEAQDEVEPADANDLEEEVEEDDGEARDEDDGAEQQHDDEDDEDDDDEDDDENDGNEDHSDDSQVQSALPTRRVVDAQDIITLRAKRFMEAQGEAGNEEMRATAADVLTQVRKLASELRSCYTASSKNDGAVIFQKLAKYFDGDALESITSYELMTSGIVEVLLKVFSAADDDAAKHARANFLEVFMAPSKEPKLATGDASSPSTAFSVLTHKLQELLSRSEHFEVITVHHNAFESARGSAANMLAKQLRLRLVGDDESGIPRPYRNIMVSIHAIATFKALDDYLRPRISMAERSRGSGHGRDGLTGAMAAYAAAMTGRGDASGLVPPPPPPHLPALGSSLPTHSTSTSKTPSRSKSTKSEPAAGADSTPPEEGSSRLRRSTRTQSAQASSTAPAPPPEASEPSTQGTVDLQEALECADEAHISDEDDEDIEAELEAIADDLEDEMMDNEVADPSAVNVEVANSGKVTARTEDGDRVATPSQTQTVPPPPPPSVATARERVAMFARYAARREMLSTPPPSSSRGMSYASALQQTPTDWHLEFSVNKQPIASETTIYRACHFHQAPSDEISGRTIWSATHAINFKRVPGPPPAANSATPSPLDAESGSSSTASGLPPSLTEHPVTAEILRLMSILHDMNANLEDVLAENKGPIQLNSEPASQFVNTKLTAKLNRQLEEPLIVASQCLPTWSEDLTRLYPFLFPFETRHLFLQSTSFGYSRLMTRWQSSQSENESRHGRHRDERPFLGRPQRQKVRISRSRILESAVKVMELYGSSSSVLEVEYFDEVGTGLGPTLEFFSTVSKEFSKKKTKLWRENESQNGDDYAFGKRGLFPAPMSAEMASTENGQRVLHLFKMLGKFVARSMLDSRIIDVSFNPTFFRVGDGSSAITPSLGAVAAVDHDLARSLKMLKKYVAAKQRIEDDTSLDPARMQKKIDNIRINDMRIDDLGLDFTLPGYPHIELQPGGAQTDVTIDNLDAYVKRVIEFTLVTGVQRQVDAFRAGFSLVFPYSATRAFTPDELVMLFGRVEEDWSLETLMDSIKADHGFNLDSKSVRNLLQVMSELTPPARRDFLQFVTGSPKLPIGGFKALTPLFTVVCKPSEPPLTSDDYLPSVMTCVNYLKMPDYSSLDVLRAKLQVAIVEGQGAFHLS